VQAISFLGTSDNESRQKGNDLFLEKPRAVERPNHLQVSTSVVLFPRAPFGAASTEIRKSLFFGYEDEPRLRPSPLEPARRMKVTAPSSLPLP